MAESSPDEFTLGLSEVEQLRGLGILQLGDVRLDQASRILSDQAEAIGLKFRLEALLRQVMGVHDFTSTAGISAVQIGIMKRVCSVWSNDGGMKTIFNPVLEESSGDMIEEWEGCLSCFDRRFLVTRPRTVKIRYGDVSMQEHVEEFSGSMARIIQHEMDHMDGILLPQKNPTRQLAVEDYRSLIKKQI